MLKTIFYLTFISWTLGELTNLEFEEAGRKYKEKIVIDKNRNIILYSIPKHAKLEETQIMHDFNLGLRAWKSYQEKKCFVTAMPKNTPNTTELEDGLQLINHKFPNLGSRINREMMIIKGLSDTSKLSLEIIIFCGIYPIYDMEVLPMKEIKRRFVAQFNRSIRVRRSNYVVKKFLSCVNAKTMSETITREIKNCNNNHAALKPVCKFQTNNCIYTVTCRRSGSGTICTLIEDHRYLTTICCDMKCYN